MKETQPMKARQIAGYLFVALAFALIILLGSGMVDPIGASPETWTSFGAALRSLLPSVLLAVAAFVVGLWLLRGGRKP